MPSHVLIDINQLSPNPLQPRGQILLESLDDLTNSIREHGVLEPLVVAETPAGLQIIAGERRWRAAIEAGLRQVPVIIRKTTPEGMLEMAIVENIQRTNLNSIERANAYRRMIEDFDMQFQDVAKKIGKSISYVSNTVRLLDLPDAVKDGLISGTISEGHAKALAGLEDRDLINEFFKQILKKELSVRQTEEMVRRIKQEKNPAAQKQVGKEQIGMLKEVEKYRKDLESAVPAKFKIDRTERQTKIIITISGGIKDSEKTFSQIYNALSKK